MNPILRQLNLVYINLCLFKIPLNVIFPCVCVPTLVYFLQGFLAGVLFFTKHYALFIQTILHYFITLIVFNKE